MKSAPFRPARLFICFMITGMVCVAPVLARPVNKQQVQQVVEGWLQHNPRPMGRPISRLAADGVPLTDDSGRTLCYSVNLEPGGFVILAADDEIEPVIAFSATGYFDGDPESPLTAMLKKDMAGRLDMVRQQTHIKSRTQQQQQKWQSLLAADRTANEGTAAAASAPSISDVRVDPLLSTQWDQGDVFNSPCYNYYTPNNYPTGCVATAMAQVMRYYAWPSAGIGSVPFTVWVNGTPSTRYTRGGNGSGGAYNWSQMPNDPQAGITTTQRAAIGALCYDAGVTVGMSYTSGGSSASLADADEQFVDTFMYTSSIYTQSFVSSGDDRLWNLLNANLDAQMPVILGISRIGGGHAVVADGYGYNGDTLYHHINMGWGGSDNAWYQLPVIDAYYTYNLIDDAVYNLYTSGTGEIISGRVVNMAGAPLSGVVVTARQGSTVVRQTSTDSRGVYALKNMASDTLYKISAAQSGESFLDQYVTTGRSTDWSAPGNRCGIDFESAAEGPPTAFDIEVQVNSTDSVIVQLQALDDGRPDPNLLQYIITSLPAHGTLSEPNVGPIDAVPYAINAADANGIQYVPCPYFGGQDSFTYKANDGGTAPTGGDSNNAVVTVTVSNEQSTGFYADSSGYLQGGFMDTEKYAARSQLIYLPGEIGPAKRITDLALHIGTAPGRTLSNFTIRMQHTTVNLFNNEEQVYDGWTTVYAADETFTDHEWVWFHLDTPFDYNGTDNLMMDISFWNSGTAAFGTYAAYNVGQNRHFVMYDRDNNAGNPLDWDYYSNWETYSINGFLPALQLISSAPIDPLPGDLDASCDVTWPDLAIFARAWQTTTADADYNPACDLTTVKGAVNLQDLLILSSQWLRTYD